jgi:hypothetical protein
LGQIERFPPLDTVVDIAGPPDETVFWAKIESPADVPPPASTVEIVEPLETKMLTTDRARVRSDAAKLDVARGRVTRSLIYWRRR